jgi:hypothetical protein
MAELAKTLFNTAMKVIRLEEVTIWESKSGILVLEVCYVAAANSFGTAWWM